MIVRAEEQRVETRTAMRGGEGAIELRHLIDGAGTFGKSRLIARLTIPAGASIGRHPHGPDAEAYVILSGEAVVTENGAEYRLGPGDAAFTGNGDSHSIANAGAEELIVLAVVFN